MKSCEAAVRTPQHLPAASRNERARFAPAARPDGLQAAIDQSPRMLAQRRLIETVFGGAIQRLSNSLEDEEPIQARPSTVNETGMPDQLKAGIESLSGMDMSGVRVHHSSEKPAQLHALAYAQGNDIHLGPGQEQHLPHEAWHVVQQRQGRVQATMQMAGVGVNDDEDLEREADLMGARAVAQEFEKRSVDNRQTSMLQPSLQLRASNSRKPTGIKNIGGLVIQKTPTADIGFAEQNRTHLENEAHPGITDDMQVTFDSVTEKIDGYMANHLNQDPPAHHHLALSAGALYSFSQNAIEAADAKWAEVGEMSRLTVAHDNDDWFAPVPATNNLIHADIEYDDQAGNRVGIEVKAVNTHTVGAVTNHINTADSQLGTRPAVNEGKIVVWIAHEDNQWPGVIGFNGRTTDAQIEADVEAQLDGMNLPNATNIRLIMVRTPNAHPSMGSAVTVQATGANGNWTAVVVEQH